MSTGVHPHLHFTFMSRARGQGQLHAPNRKWSVEVARCLQLPLLLLGSCPGSLAVRCSTVRSCRGPKSANLDVHFASGKVLGIMGCTKMVIIHSRV